MTDELQANPLREGLRIRRTPEPCVAVIFGITGDLARRKLIPALHALSSDHLLPPSFAVVGYGRRAKSDDDFRRDVAESLKSHSRVKDVAPDSLDEAASNFFYVQGELDDPAGFRNLSVRVAQLERERHIASNRLIYLATPPEQFGPIVTQLGAAGLNRSANGWTRIIIEKPFGHDLSTACALNTTVREVFDESQTYRIDHYLGKENVQNILVFRFANGIFEPIWNRRYIDHVQITVAETLGVESRAGYFDHAGMTRDIIQNHMMQLLCLTAMEPPVAVSGEAVRDEKVKVLRALRPVAADAMAASTVRAQYTAGTIDGKPAPGYREEAGIAPDSRTETFAAMKLYLDNWRWAGVPFYLRAGKRLPRRVTEIAIGFKQAPMHLFSHAGEEVPPNMLTMDIQPDEGMTLRFFSKIPGQETRIRPVLMTFRYGTSFGMEPPEAYERLLLDAMLGDPTLFTRADEVECSWRFFSPLLQQWRDDTAQPLPQYECGTWGPEQASSLLAADSHKWRRL